LEKEKKRNSRATHIKDSIKGGEVKMGKKKVGKHKGGGRSEEPGGEAGRSWTGWNNVREKQRKSEKGTQRDKSGKKLDESRQSLPR